MEKILGYLVAAVGYDAQQFAMFDLIPSAADETEHSPEHSMVQVIGAERIRNIQIPRVYHLPKVVVSTSY